MNNVWMVATRALLFLTLLLGVVYPLSMTAIAQLLFSERANGSLILQAGRPIGSQLIGQKFESPKHFWPRPSAVDFNPLPSGGSNLGLSSRVLQERVRKARESGAQGDLLYTSASGLDPHVSPQSALAQVSRVAQATGLEPNRLERLIAEATEARQLGLLGEPRVNVLMLNLALEAQTRR